MLAILGLGLGIWRWVFSIAAVAELLDNAVDEVVLNQKLIVLAKQWKDSRGSKWEHFTHCKKRETLWVNKGENLVVARNPMLQT